MESRTAITTSLIAAGALALGTLAGSWVTYNSEQQKTQSELIRFAASNPDAKQAVNNLKFWTRMGLLNLSRKDLDDAGCDCVGVCVDPSKRKTC